MIFHGYVSLPEDISQLLNTLTNECGGRRKTPGYTQVLSGETMGKNENMESMENLLMSYQDRDQLGILYGLNLGIWMVLYGFIWFYMVLHGFIWFYMVDQLVLMVFWIQPLGI